MGWVQHRGWARIEAKGCITFLRPSRRPLRGLLRMRYSFDRTKKMPHPEEAAEAAVSKAARRRSNRSGISCPASALNPSTRLCSGQAFGGGH